MVRVSLTAHEEVKQGIQNVRLEQRHDQKVAILGWIQHSQLLVEVLIVLLLRLRVSIEANRIKTAFIDHTVEGVLIEASLQEVALSVGDARHVPFLHFLNNFGHDVRKNSCGNIEN